MTFFDIMSAIVWIYLAGAVIVGGFYAFIYSVARSKGAIVSDTPVFDIALTAALWPAFIAFLINKMTKRD